MNEISSFFNEELNTIAAKLDSLNDEKYSIQLDIEFFQKAISKISESNDDAENVFLSLDNSDSFNNVELKKLKNQMEQLVSREKEIDKLIVDYSKKYEELSGLKSISDNMVMDNQDRIENLSLYEADRRKIAMDIHDTVVQTLSALIMKNNFVIKVMGSDPVRAKLQLKDNNEALKASIQELRNIIFNLRPMGFDDLCFGASFSNICEKLSMNTDMTINYYSDIKDEIGNKFLIINVLRIVQELINNSIKHSGGDNIDVELIVKDEMINLKVIDNGKGFDINNINCSGYGLSIIKDRVNLCKGTIDAGKIVDVGMRVLISIPYNGGDINVN